MHILNVICLTIAQLAKQMWKLPESIAAGIKRGRRQAASDEAEAERLDRIRHPSKYLGK